MPTHFLIKKDLRSTLRSDIAFRSTAAFHHWQSGEPVLSNLCLWRGLTRRVVSVQPLSHQFCDDIFETPVFIQSAKLHFTNQIIWKLEGGLHAPSFMGNHIAVKPLCGTLRYRQTTIFRVIGYWLVVWFHHPK
jgi:hypothetical protein